METRVLSTALYFATLTLHQSASNEIDRALCAPLSPCYADL